MTTEAFATRLVEWLEHEGYAARVDRKSDAISIIRFGVAAPYFAAYVDEDDASLLDVRLEELLPEQFDPVSAEAAMRTTDRTIAGIKVRFHDAGDRVAVQFRAEQFIAPAAFEPVIARCLYALAQAALCFFAEMNDADRRRAAMRFFATLADDHGIR